MSSRGKRASLSRRVCCGLWLMAALSLCVSTCARPDGAWERVQTAGVLRVGMDASFPPFESITADGTLAGLDVDLARELGRRMQVEVQFVANLPYDGLYDALSVGRVDVVISALVADPARMADFAYSAHYFDAGYVLVTRATGPPIAQMTDLEEHTLAVEFGSRGDQEARQWVRRNLALTLTTYQTSAAALAAVAAGEADAALVDHVSALAAAGADDRLNIAAAVVVSEPYAAAVRRDSRHLLRAINQALVEMEDDGTVDVLRERWLTGN
jgi:ABC-type amino acid transport substrate-binding protein